MKVVLWCGSYQQQKEEKKGKTLPSLVAAHLQEPETLAEPSWQFPFIFFFCIAPAWSACLLCNVIWKLLSLFIIIVGSFFLLFLNLIVKEIVIIHVHRLLYTQMRCKNITEKGVGAGKSSRVRWETINHIGNSVNVNLKPIALRIYELFCLGYLNWLSVFLSFSHSFGND